MAKKSEEKTGKKEEKNVEKVEVKQETPSANAGGSSGSRGNVMAAVAYLMTVVTGAIIYFVADKKDKYTRFHAIQAVLWGIVVFIVIFIAGIIGFVVSFGVTAIAGPLGCCVWIVMLLVIVIPMVLTLYLIYKAYTGVKFKLPIIGNLAEKYA